MRFFIAFVFMFVSFMAFAQMPAPLPEDPGLAVLFSEVVKLYKNWDGLSLHYQIASVLFLLVALFKNSMFKPLWDSLGKWKPVVAPLLSVIAFLFLVQPFTFETFIAAITTGVAAGFYAQLIDALKTIPGIGQIITAITDIVGRFFKKPQE